MTIKGRYELIRPIGAGGMGEVWLAHDRKKGAQVAVKLLNAACNKDPGIRKRFEREAQILSRLRHPNLVPVHDSGATSDRLFLVMDYIEGSDLASIVQGQGPLPPHRAATLVLDVLEGLAAAHAQGVVHRDVKPHNVLVGKDSKARLGDFGIARVTVEEGADFTRSGAFLGSPSFMAPEQRGDARRVGAPADVYGAGSTLYYTLTGVAGAQLHVDQVQEDEVKMVVPGPLAEIISRATRFRTSERYADAREMADALRDALAIISPEQPAVRAPRTPPPPPPLTPPRAALPTMDWSANRSAPTEPATTWDRTITPRQTRAIGVGALLIGLIMGTLLVLGDTSPPASEGASPQPGEATAPHAQPPVPPDPGAAARPKTGGGSHGPDEAATTLGRLAITLRPSGTVLVDDTPRGTAPVELNLPEGSYALTLLSPTLDPVSLTVQVSASAPQLVCWDFDQRHPC